MDLSQLTSEQIELLRALVAEHDQTAGKPVNEFDLNRPPKLPYSFQKFPMAIYDHVGRRHKTVRHDGELDEHLAAGWKTQPYPAEPEAQPELDAADTAEAAAIDAQLVKKSKKQA